MFPENVLKIIRKFADDVVGSLQYSLKQVPENLIYVKMKRKWKKVQFFVCNLHFQRYFSQFFGIFSCKADVENAEAAYLGKPLVPDGLSGR